MLLLCVCVGARDGQQGRASGVAALLETSFVAANVLPLLISAFAVIPAMEAAL